jgi:hypothetical protein
MRVGLSTYGDVPTGLGTLAARFWRHRARLGLTARVVTAHPKLGPGTLPHGAEHLGNPPGFGFARWVWDTDAVLFLERPMPAGAAGWAKQAGKRTVLAVMPEWLPASAAWLGQIDRFIVFTRQGEGHCRKLGLGGRTVRVACPLDLEELPFRERTRVESVVYLDGWGGCHERKGWPEVAELLRLAPGSVRVKSQRRLPGAEPAAGSPAALYADADAVLVPGRFDGLGLTVLEGLASGCVVLATDAEPYSEFVRAAYGRWAGWGTFAADGARAATVSVGGNPWPSRPASVEAMRAALLWLHCTPGVAVSTLSRLGRDYAERTHGAAAWAALGEAIRG